MHFFSFVLLICTYVDKKQQHYTYHEGNSFSENTDKCAF